MLAGGFIYPHSPLALFGCELVERQANPALLIAPTTSHQDEIALVDLAVAQLPVQLDQRRALLGQEHHAGGVAIEPMHELEEPRFRPRCAHLLDESGRDAAAAM